MAYANTHGASTHGLRDRTSEILRNLSGRVERYRLYRRTLDELNELSNRELADLGLHRSAIRATAQAAAYGN